MLCAVELLSNVYNKNGKVKITSRTYQYLKERLSILKSQAGKDNRKIGMFRWCHNIKTNRNKIIKKTDILPSGYAEGFIMSNSGKKNGIEKRLDYAKQYEYNGESLTL